MTEQIVTFTQAWDCILIPSPACKRHEDCDPENPSKNYGRGGMRITHVLKSDDLAVQFVWSPGVYLPETDKWVIDNGHAVYRGFGEPSSFWEPRAWDLGWHVPYTEPPEHEDRWELDWPFYGTYFDTCEHFEQGCYYDGSSLNAEPILDRLVREGGEVVWEELERYAEEVVAR